MLCLPIQGLVNRGDYNTGHYIKPRVHDLKFVASTLIFDIGVSIIRQASFFRTLHQ